MKKKAYTLFDKKTGLYTKPVYFHNNPDAIRAITREANDLETSMGQHPEDYSLFYIGEYDDETGFFTQETTHLPVCNCHELLALDS